MTTYDKTVTVYVDKESLKAIDVVGDNMNIVIQNSKDPSQVIGYTPSIDGDDVVLTTDSVEYYATFTPSADTTWDSVKYKADTEYRLELVQVAKSSNPSVLADGTYTWGYVERNATSAETEAGYGDKISLFIDYTDIRAGKVFGGDIVFHKVVNGVTVADYSVAEFYEDYASIEKDDFATANVGKFNSQVESCEISLIGYVTDGTTDVYVNDSENINKHEFVVTPDKEGLFEGTRFNETAFSAGKGGEVFSLDGGHDKIYLTGNFGEEAVILEKGEEYGANMVDIVIKDGKGNAPALVYTENGDDLEISTGVKYVATVDIAWTNNDKDSSGAYTGHYIDSATGEADITGKGVEFVIKQYNTPGYKNLQGKYMFGSDAYGADGKVCVFLDNSDFNHANTTDSWYFGNDSSKSGITISNLKLWRVVNNEKVAATAAEINAIKTSSMGTGTGAESFNGYDDEAVKALFDQQISGTVILQDYLKADTLYDGDEPMLGVNVNGLNIEDKIYAPAHDETNKKYTGSRLNETVVSGTDAEIFDLGTTTPGYGVTKPEGVDTITFKGAYNNDKVVANEDENLVLDFNGNEVKYVVKGNNVVLSTDVKYYATVKLDHDYVVDGTVKDATTGKLTPISIVDKLDSAKYTTTDTTLTAEIDLDTYKALDATTKAKYTCKEAVMKLELSDLFGNGKYYFGTDNLYTLGTGESAKNVKWGVDIAEVTKIASSMAEQEVCYYDQEKEYVKLSDLTIYEVVNSKERDITEDFVYGMDTPEKYFAATESSFNAQTSGSVTFEGYAVTDPEADITVKALNTYDFYKEEYKKLDELTYDAAYDEKTKTFSGTRLNEYAKSNVVEYDKNGKKVAGDDKFNLGTGSDSISFHGDFGTDKVTMNKDEELGLWFSTSVDDLNYKVSGKNLTISTDVSYYATFTPSENVTWDSFTYEKGKEYTLELVQVKKSSNETQLPSGTYTWGMVERDATKAETDAGYGDKISLFLDYTDINAGKVFGADIEFHKVVNGEDNVVTKAELYGSNPLTAETFAIANSFWNDYQISGSVTVENFTSYKDDLRVNGQRVHFGVTPKNDVFTGTKNDDYAVSTDHDEKFDLKQGTDEILFSGDFGIDTVKLTKGENLYMNFKDANGAYHDVVSEVVGKDLVLSSEVSYYATFTPSADTTWDSVKYEAGKEYRLELVKVAKSSNPSVLADGTYTWGYVERNATSAETEAGYGDKISLFIDYTDIQAGKVFGGDIVFHKVVNGVKTDYSVSQFYGAGYASITKGAFETANAGKFDDQISGAVVLTDFAAKDLGATVYVNDSATPFTYATTAIDKDNLNEYVVKGKITGTTGNDSIDASSYVSTNNKGLTINSGSGNDIIAGTSYKDTVKVTSKVDEQAQISEAAGVNKVTFGKGNDKFTATAYSSNTVTANTGDNQFDLGSAGTNKVTAKNGSNYVEISGGVNTVKLGNASERSTAANSWTKLLGHGDYAHNEIDIDDGQNKITSGKGVDEYDIDGGINNISSGDGADTFDISAGENTIKTGAGNKSFDISGGINTISTGKGSDEFTFGNTYSGKTVVKAGAGEDAFFVESVADGSYMYLDGGKGTDLYDFSALGSVSNANIVVNDTKGAVLSLNTTATNDKYSLFFDVTLKKVGEKAIKSVGKEVLFTEAVDGDFEGGIDVKSFKAVDAVKVGNSLYDVSIDNLASDVANWLAGSKVYKSTAEVFATGDADDVAALIKVYTDGAAGCYTEKAI